MQEIAGVSNVEIQPHKKLMTRNNELKAQIQTEKHLWKTEQVSKLIDN